jgi:hypothetical protein
MSNLGLCVRTHKSPQTAFREFKDDDIKHPGIRVESSVVAPLNARVLFIGKFAPDQQQNNR